MARRTRLDAELVRRGLAQSREQAAALVSAGKVTVSGQPATKSATAVDVDAPVIVATDDGPAYVSRGGLKLTGALDALGGAGPVIEGRRCLDAGASTGGFTDALLRRGAREVVAVDVGYGQLAWSLRTDARVVVVERTNVRTLTPGVVGVPLPSLTVADLSFISLRLVLSALRACATDDADHFLLVKPQFEVGKDSVGRGGVVRDPELRARAITSVATAAATCGLGVCAVVASPLPGPAGNVEYFVWFRQAAPPLDPAMVERAVAEGPQ